MTEFIKKNIFLILLFVITLFTGILTFLTFIDKSFISLSDKNLQYLLFSNIALLGFLFLYIYKEIKKILKNEINHDVSRHGKRYLIYFSLFTLIPSILISAFSLFLFSFALEKYFDKKVTTVVNNSYALAKDYLNEIRDKIESDIILVAFDTTKSKKILNDRENEYRRFLNTQKLIRNIDEIHIIDVNKKLLFTTLNNKKNYIPPVNKAIDLVLENDRPLKIINAFENKSAAIMKLQNFEGRYIYVVKYLDKEISRYLTESQEAINFYYTVEEKSTGIKISFAIIYVIIVTLLLFVSISIAIKFSSMFFRSINNLIFASTSIGDGNLDIKVPEIKTDKDLQILNKNFNKMIDKLKLQQEKLIINERHEAWGSLARKLAHEIKNPLTPIQLILDKIKNKYSEKFPNDEQDKFNENLKVINNQIKQIENLVNEFSDFARMPKPILKNNDLIKIIKSNIKLLHELDNTIVIKLHSKEEAVFLNCDFEQINRVFLNLIKNAIESIQQKNNDNLDYIKKIDIELINNSSYIEIIIADNGIGFKNIENINDIMNPYFTTKKNGTGLGLSIVNKIINDHNGVIELIHIKDGAKIKINFSKK
jgi:two-component system nitrogen regulation sensor histidine kinase NtrY